MAIQIAPGRWQCGYCGKEFPKFADADVCRESHELVYVPLTRTELNKLFTFMMSPNEDILTEELVSKIRKYNQTGIKK